MFKPYLGKRTAKVSNYFSKGRVAKSITASVCLFMLSFTALNYEAVVSLSSFYLTNLFSDNTTLAREILTAAPKAPRLIEAGAEKITDIKDFVASLPVAPKTDRVIIERLGINVPLQFLDDDQSFTKDFDTLESELQQELEKGVVHYPGTALPGGEGNVFITGHSSYYPWAPGKYKDVFAILHAAQTDDIVTIFHKGEKFDYKIYDKVVVTPQDVSVLEQTTEKTISLMTCTPVGTNLKRLILKGRLAE